MKKLIATALIGLVAGLALTVIAEQPIVVGTESTLILPDRARSWAAAWATNTVYAQGDYVTSSNRIYWAVTGGTSSTDAADAPYHGYTTNDVADGAGVTWRFLDRYTKRQGFLIVNPGPGDWHVSLTKPATTNHPKLVETGSWRETGYQGELWVISTTNSRPFTPVEW